MPVPFYKWVWHGALNWFGFGGKEAQQTNERAIREDQENESDGEPMEKRRKMTGSIGARHALEETDTQHADNREGSQGRANGDDQSRMVRADENGADSHSTHPTFDSSSSIYLQQYNRGEFNSVGGINDFPNNDLEGKSRESANSSMTEEQTEGLGGKKMPKKEKKNMREKNGITNDELTTPLPNSFSNLAENKVNENQRKKEKEVKMDSKAQITSASVSSKKTEKNEEPKDEKKKEQERRKSNNVNVQVNPSTVNSEKKENKRGLNTITTTPISTLANSVKSKGTTTVSAAKNKKNGISKKSSETEEEQQVLDPSTPFYFEKKLGVHYFGKIYRLRTSKHKNGEEKETARVDRILAGQKLTEKMLRMAETTKELGRIDFVVGCTKPDKSWTSGAAKCQLLVVYEGAKRGRWMEFDSAEGIQREDAAILEFLNLQKQLDHVEEILHEECEARHLNYDQLYPARYLVRTNNGDLYGNSELHVLRTLQAARQTDVNQINMRDGVPPIFFIDWSGKGKVCDFANSSINNFQYTNHMAYSKRVQKKIDSGRINRIDELCGSGCSCEESSAMGGCRCNKRTKFATRHECFSKSCRCDPKTCNNRTVQRGRQIPLIVTAHPIKGWTTRVYVDVDEGEFVHEYVGELITNVENKGRPQTYAVDQADSAFDANAPDNRKDAHPARKHHQRGKEAAYCHRTLVNNADRVANEARFDSHGCRPRMKTVVTYVEREAFAVHRTAFFAARRLRAGEEITWNYFMEPLKEKVELGEPFATALLPNCDCDLDRCPIKINQEPYKDEEKGEENDQDSFEDSDEENMRKDEERAQKKASREERNRKREERNAEKSSSSSSSSDAN